MLDIKKLIRSSAFVAVIGGLACGDLLEVQDPSRFTDADLDAAPQAVADGVEGDLNAVLDNMVYAAALMSDEFQHTGTWIQWDEVDHGLLRYDNSPVGDGFISALLRTRFASQDAQARFERLETEGTDIPDNLIAQVQAVEAWADLIIAQNYCEAPGEAGGSAISDMALMTQAVTKLTTAIATAQGAGATEYQLWATAGRARANLLLGNLTAALADAQSVPDGWEYTAKYQQGGAENAVVNLATVGFNNAGGIREKWWSRVDLAEDMLSDQFFPSELDPRIPIRHIPGVLGVDGVTDFYSQWKYQELGDNIQFTDSKEMRLIEAEIAWRNSDFPAATGILNALRADAGLSPVTATTSQAVFDLLLNERFAEMFMEAQRANDLHRFDLYQQLVDAGDFVGTIPDRAIKFPLTSEEAENNTNIENDVAQRCMPTL